MGYFESCLKQTATKILLLTNPHNPTGKVFSDDELKHIVALCQQYNVFIISDDIHKDIVYQKAAYTPVTEFTTKNVVLCCSATKTFNTPGLIGAYLFEPEAELREMFLCELKQKMLYHQLASLELNLRWLLIILEVTI